MIYTRRNSAPAKTNSPSRNLVPAITCTEHCTSQEGRPRPSHLNRPLGALPAHVGQNANLTCCLLYLLIKRRGTVRGKAEKQQKQKPHVSKIKKNGRFHVKFLDWNEVDRGMGWEAYVPRASGGRTHRTYARTYALLGATCRYYWTHTADATRYDCDCGKHRQMMMRI